MVTKIRRYDPLEKAVEFTKVELAPYHKMRSQIYKQETKALCLVVSFPRITGKKWRKE